MKNLALLCFIFVLSLATGLGQVTGVQTVHSDAPSYDFFTKVFITNGNTLYVCYANSTVTSTVIIQTSISNATPAVVTATAHGINANTNPVVTITGGTGNWTAFNGTWVVTYIDANSFSIPVNTTSFGAVSGTIVIKSAAPRSVQPVWAVQKIVSDSAGNPLAIVWAAGGYSNICANNATLSYQ